MKKIALIIFFLVLIFSAFAQSEGKVIRVKDGDTYVIQEKEITHTVRLLNVDAPELNQNWGLYSWMNVKNLILEKTVRFDVLKTDLYGRELAYIYLDGQSLDYILIENGWAWHYVNYDKNEKLDYLMQMATKERKGLWECGKEKVCPPWIFRQYNARNRSRFCKGCLATKI